jgi:hypothetical protein
MTTSVSPKSPMKRSRTRIDIAAIPTSIAAAIFILDDELRHVDWHR